jgi:transcriptional regulator with XRE-family HTH domain
MNLVSIKTSTIAIPDFRERRERANLSQQAVAERAGCSIATVRGAEHGLRVSCSMADRLRRAFGDQETA